MAVEVFQQSVAVSKLYSLKKQNEQYSTEQITPNMYASVATTVYTSNSATQPANLAAMVAESETVLGFAEFEICPRWIAFTGTDPEIILTGVFATEIGAIS